jgi:hypothetical protein
VAVMLGRFLSSLKRLDEWIDGHVQTEVWANGQTMPKTVSLIFTRRSGGIRKKGVTLEREQRRDGAIGYRIKPDSVTTTIVEAATVDA